MLNTFPTCARINVSYLGWNLKPTKTYLFSLQEAQKI